VVGVVGVCFLCFEVWWGVLPRLLLCYFGRCVFFFLALFFCGSLVFVFFSLAGGGVGRIFFLGGGVTG